jgi:signal transduction histidine kinase
MFQSKEDYVYFITITSFVVILILSFFFIVLFLNVKIRGKRKVEILQAILTTEESERNRIASDLHDEIGPFISALKLEIENVLDNTTDEENRSDLISVNGHLNTLIETIRFLSKSMSSAIIIDFGLIKALNEFRRVVQKSGEISFSFTYDELPPITIYAQSTIYRILQELLNNSLRHSNCSEIDLSIHYDQPEIYISYRDNGSQDKKELSEYGIGRKNIESRVNVLHGTFTAPDDFTHGSDYAFKFHMKYLADKRP